MALYRITTTRASNAGMQGPIDPGMSIEMSSIDPVILAVHYLDKINELFRNKFGVDLRARHSINHNYLTITKIS